MRAQKAAQSEALRIAWADPFPGPNVRGLMQSLISFDNASHASTPMATRHWSVRRVDVEELLNGQVRSRRVY